MIEEADGNADPTAPPPLERVLRRWEGPVVRVAYRVTGCLEDAEDVRQAVFLKLLERRFLKSFQDEFWGRDPQKRPGVMGFDVDGVGPVFAVNLTFPVAEKLPEETPDEWEAARREARGERRIGGAVTPLQTEKVVSVAREAIADFGSRIRGLDPKESVAILIYADQSSPIRTRVARRATGQNVAESKDLAHELLYLGDVSRRNDLPPAAMVRAKGEDIEALRKGELKREDFLGKIEVLPGLPEKKNL